jgi:hypothetical protein
VGAVDPGLVVPVRLFFLTHFFFFLTYPFLHFFFASTAVGEPLPSEAALAELAGTAHTPVANKSVASTPNTAFRAFCIVVLPFLPLNRPRRERSSKRSSWRQVVRTVRSRSHLGLVADGTPTLSIVFPVDVTVTESGRDVCADGHCL